MSDKKNIDRLFQEKFKDFEEAPNEIVWERINKSLHGKKKRRIIPIWWQIGGIAATVVLLLTLGVSIFSSDTDPQETPIVNTDQKNQEKNNNEKESTDSDLEKNQNELNSNTNDGFAENESSQNSNEENVVSTKNSSSELVSSESKGAKSNAVAKNSNKDSEVSKNQLVNKSNDINSTIADNLNSKNKSSDSSTSLNKDELRSVMEQSKNNEKNALTENPNSQNKTKKQTTNNKDIQENLDKDKAEELLKPSDKKQSIEDAIASNDDPNNEKEKEEENNRWSIAPNVAPVYFSSLGQGSSLDNQFNGNSKGSDINMSYGIKGSYAVSKKLKVRAGINRVDLNQTTSDVFAFTGATTAARGVDAQFNNIKFRDGTQTVTMMSSRIMSNSTAPEAFNTKSTGTIDQRFGFIEVPLELEYKLLDKKFGVNVIGGFSTLFLNNNEIYADVNGTSTLIGEANNINSTSFSANFGLGMDYNLSKQWNINLEPTFKYQINTFNNTTGNYRPFFIGVYTGLSFKF